MTPAESLETTLETLLAREGLGILVREFGSPLSNPFFWPYPGELGEAEREIFALMRSQWKADWLLEDRALQQVIRQLLWEAVGAGEQDTERIKSAVGNFVAELTVQTTSFTAVVAIEGVSSLLDPVDVGGCRFGIIQDLLPEGNWRDVVNLCREAVAVWALLTVQVPSEKHISGVVATKAEDALDLLSTLDHRSRLQMGYPGTMRVGRFGFVVGDGEKPREFPIPDEWWFWGDYRLDPKTAKEESRLRYLANPFPWRGMTQGTELSRALKESYRRFGHAKRLSHEPEAAIPLALSAIEYLLAGKRDKRHTTVARMILASIALDEPTVWPLKMISWFERRNVILHESFRPRWTSREANSAFWSLYRVLDLAASFAVEKGLDTRAALIEALENEANVLEARGAVESEIRKLRELADSALTSQYRRLIGDEIDTWKSVLRHLPARRDT